MYTRAFQRASEILGGSDALREHLQVPLENLSSWMQGNEAPPTPVFLRIVDLLIERDRLSGVHDGVQHQYSSANDSAKPGPEPLKH